jgi:type III restriction enzyme
MPLTTSPFEIINPNDRYIPSLKDKDLTKVLPPLVTKIRQEVYEWRKKNYDGVSETSKALLEWWFVKEHENFRYYFAQREAVETIIYLFEVAKIRDKEQLFYNYNSLTDVKLEHFTESWLRLVTKMATGSGKTKVMSLLLLWSYFNRIYENNNELSSNFLIIAPNIIVLDRLKTDFEGLNIFRNDPCLPDDGINNQNWKSDFLNKAQVHIQKQARVKDKQGNIFLTNIQQIYVGREKEVSLQDEDLTEFFFGKKVKSKLENTIDLLKLIKQVNELIILNDEAHHINDEQQVWYKTIQNIHNSLLTNESRLALQLDFTATPKHKDSSIFVQTVSDYPLTEAIHQNIVKNIEVPKKLYMDDFKIYPSTKYSEKWRDFINLGYVEWKKTFNVCKETGKKAILFIMTDDTKNCDDVSNYLENNYDDLKGKILTIHTNNNGEIVENENAPKKTKDELEKLRIEANTIDSMDNKNVVVVSVLMLKEGWDVNNVTTIVGLRAFTKPKILPEQTLGRGLRRMYRGEDMRERLTVIGTPNFMEFAKELEKEGIKVKEIDVGENVSPFFITSKLVDDQKVINKFDIEFPQIIEKIFRNDELIKTIDVSKFQFNAVEYKNLDLIKKIKIEWEDIVSGETTRIEEYERNYALDVYNILGAFAKEIMDELKLKQGLGFDIICEKTKDLIENYLFGKKIEFENDLTKANLCIIETRRSLVQIMVSEIKKVIISDKTEKKIAKILKFSDDKAAKVKDVETAIYFEPEKSVYTKHFLANSYEEEMNIYLESLIDVKSCIKNMGFIKIPYQNSKGIWSHYIPDFFIKLSDNNYCILETKGAEYLNDPLKKEALKNKVKQINEGQDKLKFTTLYVLQDKFNKLEGKPSTFKLFFEIFKDLDLDLNKKFN